MIPLEIIFDEEPPQGIEFKNGKIYVNTKSPHLYQELHQQAVTRYMNENEEQIEGGLNEIIVNNRQTKELFPRISKDLNGQVATDGSDQATAESILIPAEGQQERRASAAMGIHDFDEDNHGSVRCPDGKTISTKL